MVEAVPLFRALPQVPKGAEAAKDWTALTAEQPWWVRSPRDRHHHLAGRSTVRSEGFGVQDN